MGLPERLDDLPYKHKNLITWYTGGILRTSHDLIRTGITDAVISQAVLSRLRTPLDDPKLYVRARYQKEAYNLLSRARALRLARIVCACVV